MPKLRSIGIVLLLIISQQLKAQDNELEKRISIELVNGTIVDLLNAISQKYNIYFSYDPEIFETEERKDYQFDDSLLKDILVAVLNENTSFKTINKQVILHKKQSEEIKMQTLRGTVIDKDTRSPVVGATIVIKDTEPLKGTITDTDGNYSIQNVPVGRQTIYVSSIGYKPVNLDKIMLLSAKEKILDIEMEESVSDIEEVTVYAYNRKEDALNEMATVGARSFSIEETEKYAGSWGDPSRMAINFAGVVMAGDEINDIVIRGNSPSALIWQLEGLPIPSPNHFDNLGATGGPVSILNNNTLSRSDFFTGAFPAEYGNGYSGVFDLHMRNGNNEKYEFTGQLSFAGFEVGAEGPVFRKNKSSFMVNYRYSMLGLVDKLLWIDGQPHYQDLTFKMNIPSKNGNISIFGFGGSSYIDFNYSFPAIDSTMLWTEIDKNGSKTAFVGINQTHFFSKNSRIISSFAYSVRNPYTGYSFKLDNEDKGKFDVYNDFESKYLFSSKFISKLNRRNLIKAGVKLEMASVGSKKYYTSIENDSIIRELNTDFLKNGLFTLNSFVDYQHKFTDNFAANSGVHFQYFYLNNSYSIEPRIGLKYNYSEKGKIGLAYGKHCQAQSLHLFFLSDSASNKNLDFTKSHQFVIGHDYSFSKNLRLKIEGYYQQLYDVPVHPSDSTFSIINYGGSDDITWIDGLVNIGTGENYGIDITFEKFLSDGYYFLLTTSLFNSTYKGIDGVKRNTRYNGNYVVNVLGGYEMRIGKNSMLDFNIRCVNAGGMRDMPIDLEKSKELRYTYYIKDKAYEHQLKGYFRLDFRVGLLLQQKKLTHEIGFEITNLTNHQNEYTRYFSSYHNKIISEYQQGFFPMGLYRISF